MVYTPPPQLSPTLSMVSVRPVSVPSLLTLCSLDVRSWFTPALLPFHRHRAGLHHHQLHMHEACVHALIHRLKAIVVATASTIRKAQTFLHVCVIVPAREVPTTWAYFSR